MAVSTNKKVTLVRFDREPVHGYVNPQTFLVDSGVELMSPSGTVSVVPWAELKAVCFVRDFSGGDTLGQRRTFATRPKTAGLWIRLDFEDGDSLEAVMPNNLLQVEPRGLSVIPPDTGLNQRVFAPRTALRQVQVLGVIGSPLRGRKPVKPAPQEQIKLFE